MFFQDLMKLAPRKPDWDLKRDIAKKLERLERRTQRAIAELIREDAELNEYFKCSTVKPVLRDHSPERPP